MPRRPDDDIEPADLGNLLDNGLDLTDRCNTCLDFGPTLRIEDLVARHSRVAEAHILAQRLRLDIRHGRVLTPSITMAEAAEGDLRGATRHKLIAAADPSPR